MEDLSKDLQKLLEINNFLIYLTLNMEEYFKDFLKNLKWNSILFPLFIYRRWEESKPSGSFLDKTVN